MSLFNSVKIYTVHIKPGAAQAYEKPAFIREGFSFWAFAFPLFWMLSKRLWLPALGVCAFSGILMVMVKSQMLNEASAGMADIGFRVLVGYLGNDWLRNRLTRKGYVMADIAASDSCLRAQQRYFERMLAA